MVQEFDNMLNGLKDKALELLPNLLLSIVVLGLGYLSALLVKHLVIRLIGYIGKQVNRRFRSANYAQAASFIGTACFWLILFVFVLLVTHILGLTIVTNWFEQIIQYIPSVLGAILIVFGGIILGNIVAEFIASVGQRMGLDYSATLGRIAQFTMIFMAVVIALDQLGVEVTFLINIIDIILAALLFGAALAFGLGARTSVSNILAAFYVRKSYKEGDEIQIGEVRGKIVKIDARSVVLDCEHGQVTIPAKEFNESKSILITKR